MLKKLAARTLVTLLLLYHPLQAQYILRITAAMPAGTHEAYLCGNFNNWNAADKSYPFRRLDAQHMSIQLVLRAGDYQFKCTRGTIATLECTAIGNRNPNHSVHLFADTAIGLVVPAWSDGYFEFHQLTDSLRYESMMGRAGYYVKINLDSSAKYAAGLYEAAHSLSPMKQARALDLQASIYTEQGNGEKALPLWFRSLALKKTLTDSSSIAFVYTGIGNTYESVADDEKAKENYLLADHWGTDRYRAFKSVPLVKIASIFYRQQNLDSAFWYANAALQCDSGSMETLLLLGDIAQKNRHEGAALQYYKAAAISTSLKAPESPLFTNSIEAYKRMGLIYYQFKNYDSAFFFARKAFAMATQLNNPNNTSSAAAGLAQLFGKQKQFDSAFFYQQIVLQKNDSLFTSDKKRQVQTIYTNEKLRQQEFLSQQHAYQSRIKIYALAGVVAFLVLAGWAYRLRLRTSFKRQLTAIEMRALRAQMNPHFIFNCLTSINRYIVMSDSKTASAYLTRFAKLIRLILDNSASEFVPFDAELQTLQLYLDMEMLRFDQSFSYEISCDGISAQGRKAIPTMIIQPFVENAIWHGLMHKEQKGQLWVRFYQEPLDIIRVEIEDNGVGRQEAAQAKSKDSLKTKSYGMQISRDRIGIINKQRNILSTVSIQDLFTNDGKAAGTKIILRLPFIAMVNDPAQSNKTV